MSETGYPPGYVDPPCLPGETDFEHYKRVVRDRSEAIRDVLNERLAQDPDLAGLSFEWEDVQLDCGEVHPHVDGMESFCHPDGKHDVVVRRRFRFPLPDQPEDS